MKIKEVEERTGLTKKAIRYYEETGLIRTIRSSNGYKDYDEETVARLLLIKKLRLLDFSVQDIKIYLFESEADKEALLREKIAAQNQEIQKLGRTRKILLQLCKGTPLETLDIEARLLPEHIQKERLLKRSSLCFALLNLAFCIVINIFLLVRPQSARKLFGSQTLLTLQCSLSALFCLWQGKLKKMALERGIFLRKRPVQELFVLLIVCILSYLIAGSMLSSTINHLHSVPFTSILDFVWEWGRFVLMFGFPLALEMILVLVPFAGTRNSDGEYVVRTNFRK